MHAMQALEEKLDQVSDLKTQIRSLIVDNDEMKLNQEELNANMTSIAKQVGTRHLVDQPK